METKVTTNGIQMIRESLPGPITFKVFFPAEYQVQNQRQQTRNSPKLFLQLRDDQTKAGAYLSDEAFDKLHKKIAEGDHIEVLRYEVQPVGKTQKIVKITIAELLGKENELNETANSFLDMSLDDLDGDRALKPTREDKEKDNEDNNKVTPVRQNPENKKKVVQKNSQGKGSESRQQIPENQTPAKGQYQGMTSSRRNQDNKEQNQKVIKSLFTNEGKESGQKLNPQAESALNQM